MKTTKTNKQAFIAMGKREIRLVWRNDVHLDHQGSGLQEESILFSPHWENRCTQCWLIFRKSLVHVIGVQLLTGSYFILQWEGRGRSRQQKKRWICSSWIFLFSLAWNTNFVSKFQCPKMILTIDIWLYSCLLQKIDSIVHIGNKACLKLILP